MVEDIIYPCDSSPTSAGRDYLRVRHIPDGRSPVCISAANSLEEMGVFLSLNQMIDLRDELTRMIDSHESK